MNNHKNHKRNKNLVRSTLTGKIINGKDVILTEEAIDYVRKMGYIVKPLSPILAKGGLMIIGLILSLAIFLTPFISAQPALFTMDFALRQNQIILIILFAISGFLIWLKQKLWGGSIVLFSGMMMAFNDINLVVSLLVMGVGIIFITSEEEA